MSNAPGRPGRMLVPSGLVAALLLAAGTALAAGGAVDTQYGNEQRLAPADPARFSDRGYPGLYTADAHCIRDNLGRYPIPSYSKFGEAAGDCGIVVPDLTNDHELQLAARIIGAPYVISVKGAGDMDDWAVCRPLPGHDLIDWTRVPYRCQWLGVVSAPADRAAVDATLPRRPRGAD